MSDIAGFATVAGSLEMTYKNNAVDKLTLKTLVSSPNLNYKMVRRFTVSLDGVYSSNSAHAGAATAVNATAGTGAVTLDLGDTVKYAVAYVDALVVLVDTRDSTG